MIAAIIIFFVVFWVDVITDLHQWGHINHTRGAIYRSIALLPAFFLCWPSLFLLPTYGAAFDMFIGVYKGLGFFYVGETSKLDILQRKYPWLQWAKNILALAGIFLFIVLAIKL